MTRFFITGAGTEIGKTHVAAGMIRYWRTHEIAARALKPIASGYQPALSARSDAGLLLRATGQTMVNDAAVAEICPWRFPDPISPDMAAARSGRSIPFADLLAFCRNAMASDPAPLLIEGVGGAMVPLDETHTVRDWIAELGIPVVMVSGGYLGAISHTLCAAEALRMRGIAIAAVVLNPMDPLPVPIERTREALLRHLGAAAPPVLIDGTPAWHAWLDGAAAG